MKNLKKISKFAFFPLVITVLSLVSCSKEQEIESKPVLRVVTASDYPPFEFMKSGKLVGFDVDLVQLIGYELDMDVVLSDMEYSSLLAAVNTGRADFAIAAFTVTPERQKNVDLSIEYYAPKLALLSMKNRQIGDFAELNGKKLGVQMGSTNEALAKERMSEVEGLELLSRSKYTDLVQELKVGRVDAILMESAQARAFAEANEGLFAKEISDQPQAYAIALKKNSPYTEKINAALKKIIESGKLEALKQKWVK